ncbi:MAG: hypothetical protein ABFC67_14760 [Mizugakiibacter sp.]|uniref:hypothetical protein n=1 Tax=Mizugakiibacter sp. TaxID=1972610 RepID=UPI0032104584
MRILPALLIAAIALSGCGARQQQPVAQHAPDPLAPVPPHVTQDVKLSDTERLRLVESPAWGAADSPCLIYTNDTYHVAQLVCHGSSDILSRDPIESGEGRDLTK